MRTGLERFAGRRTTFTAVFWMYGSWRKRGYSGNTILLRDIRDAGGHQCADHVWINYTAPFDAQGMFRKGERVRFTAAVSEYIKGYFGGDIEEKMKRPYRIDYRLKYPHNVERIAYSGTTDLRIIGDPVGET